MSYKYELKLTDAEVNTLAWLADRGYFPTEIYDNMQLIDTHDGIEESTWTFPEHIAWSLLELREEDPDAYLACLGEPLLSKILELEENIV
jgi:hypothetical protein